MKVWVLDEVRFDLRGQTRRYWGLRGVPVVVSRQQRYQRECLQLALAVGEGCRCFAILPSVGLGPVGAVFGATRGQRP
ncbi:MAG: hypothetical protein EBS05_22355 [Proteobacteria bacterium]|nr:hypothetical protein [Pseudomonadota bacterium]